MKKNLLLLTFLFFFFSCKKADINDFSNVALEKSGTSEQLNLLLSTSSLPWTTSSNVTVYARNSAFSTVPLNIPFPWYSVGNPLAVSNPDMQPSDGWELAYENIGEVGNGVDFPFFALYNKHRGILRLFLYNAQRVQANYFRGELSFLESQYSSSLLSFVATEDKSTYGNYDPNEKQTTIAYANSYSSWINFDFTLANYDTRKTNRILDFKMHSINESNIQLTSTEFTLAHELASKAQLGTSSSSFSTALKNGQKYIKSFEDTKKILKDATAKDGPFKAKAPSLGATINQFLSSNSYLNAVPYLGSALGVINSFIGGKTQPFPWQMLKFEGTLKLEGTITSTIPIYSLALAVGEGNTNPYVVNKLNNTEFGVFNLTSDLELQIHSNEEIEWEGANPDWYENKDYQRITKFRVKNGLSNLIINPNLGMTLVSKRIRLVSTLEQWSEGPHVYENFVDWTPTAELETAYIENDVAPGYSNETVYPKYAGVELVFRPNNVSNNSKDIVFLKVYKLKQ